MLHQPYIQRLVNAKQAWYEKRLKKKLQTVGERRKQFRTDAGIPVKSLYTPLDLHDNDFDYLTSYGSPKFGVKSEIALSSVYE